MSRDLVVATVPEQGMKTEEFIGAQTAASRVFGRDKDAGVIFAGDAAHVRTDGTIVYPALAEGNQMTKEEVLVARGFADHETAHKRYTDTGVIKKFNAYCKRTDNQLLQQVAFAIDDIRVDGLAVRDYSGAKANLEATSEAVYRELAEYAKDNADEVNDLDVTLPAMITAEGRRRMGYRCDSIEPSLDALTPENRKKVEGFVDIAMQCKDADPQRGTQQVVDIAKTIMKLKEEQEQEEQQEQGQGQGQGDGEGEGQGGEAEGEGDNGGQGGGKKVIPKDQQEPDDSGKPRQGSSDGPLIDDMTERALMKNFRKYTDSDERTYRPFSTEFDDMARTDNNSHMSPWMQRFNGQREYERITHELHGKISTMARKLERALLSIQRRDWQTNTEFGSLDPKRLAQAGMGKPNVFRLREQRKELDTAVSMLIDLSGSMEGTKARLAQQVSIAMALVMEKVGITYEVLGFHNNCPHFFGVREGKSRHGGMSWPGFDSRIKQGWIDDMMDAYYQRNGHRGVFSRYEPVQMYEFKSFDKRLVQEREQMGVIRHCAGGNNSDPDAVKVATQHLKARPESRRILFVLSDGMPSAMGGFGDGHLAQHLRNRIDDVSKMGMECVGIGIKSEAVSRFYPKHVVVNELGDLPKAAFDQLAKILVNDRYKVDNSDLMKVSHGR